MFLGQTIFDLALGLRVKLPHARSRDRIKLLEARGEPSRRLPRRRDGDASDGGQGGNRAIEPRQSPAVGWNRGARFGDERFRLVGRKVDDDDDGIGGRRRRDLAFEALAFRDGLGLFGGIAIAFGRNRGHLFAQTVAFLGDRARFRDEFDFIGGVTVAFRRDRLQLFAEAEAFGAGCCVSEGEGAIVGQKDLLPLVA